MGCIHLPDSLHLMGSHTFAWLDSNRNHRGNPWALGVRGSRCSTVHNLSGQVEIELQMDYPLQGSQFHSQWDRALKVTVVLLWLCTSDSQLYQARHTIDLIDRTNLHRDRALIDPGHPNKCKSDHRTRDRSHTGHQGFQYTHWHFAEP